MNRAAILLNIINFIANSSKRELLFRTLKFFLFFFSPIILITNSIYRKNFGDNNLVTGQLFDLINQNTSQFFFAIGVFAITYFLAYALEKYIFPISTIAFVGTYTPETFKPAKDVADRYIRKIATKKEVKAMAIEVKNEKIEIYTSLSFIPVTFILWITWLAIDSSLFYLILIIIVIVLHFWLMKIINTTINVYSK